MEKEGIFALPGSLQLVLDEFKESDSMKKVFGELAFRDYDYTNLEEYDKY